MPVDSTTRSDEQSHVAKLTQKAPHVHFDVFSPSLGSRVGVAMVPEKTRAVQQFEGFELGLGKRDGSPGYDWLAM